MGRPKASLPFDGEPLISHVVRTLTRLFGDVVVVASPEQDLPALPVAIVRDEVAYQGPVGGICYGLRAARGEACFVSSCDSAFLNSALIAHLVSRITGHDVVVPFWQGRLQPLHAVYRRTVLPLLEGQLSRGELRPVFLFDKVRTLRIEEDEIRRFDADGSSFFNMNTPEDYAAAVERWSARSRCTVELYGVARMLAGTSELDVALLPGGATVSHALAAVLAQVPALAGRVIAADGSRLLDGYACNVNGREFVRHPGGVIHPGDRIMILSADAGG
jgi:molybdopterin-guanine dinucleotide biosynthesis protein A